MALTLYCVGRLKSGPERELFMRYWKRSEASAPKLGFGRLATVELREAQGRSADTRKAHEGQSLLQRVESGSAIIAFDEGGETLSTTKFCEHLQKLRDQGREIVLIIGGPDGLDAPVLDRSATRASFGRMTIPHQLVRVLVAEQLYRAFSIMEGHPYHRP